MSRENDKICIILVRGPNSSVCVKIVCAEYLPYTLICASIKGSLFYEIISFGPLAALTQPPSDEFFWPEEKVMIGQFNEFLPREKRALLGRKLARTCICIFIGGNLEICHCFFLPQTPPRVYAFS